MAKKSTKRQGRRKRTEGDAPGAEGAANTSYSTRFEERQRELVEQAAKVLGVKPAKLIRDAAVERAADVLNASGEARRQLQALAHVTAQQLVNPRAEYVHSWSIEGLGDCQTESIRVAYEDRAKSQAPVPVEYLEHRSVVADSVKPLRPSDAELTQIKSALETCGSEFVQMVLARWSAGDPECATYEPRVSADGSVIGDAEE